MTRIVLELGCNHQGDARLAEQMVLDAAKLGAFGVKLQKRCPEAIPEELKSLPRNPDTSFGETYYAHRKALELSDDDLLSLKKLAESLGLVFAVSAFDLCSLRLLVEELGVKYVKLPSQYLLHHEMNAYLCGKKNDYGLFTMRSTGMHTVMEVGQAIHTWPMFDVTMYCRSVYPLSFEQVDFAAARMVYDWLPPEQRGYSSHDIEGCAVVSMVLLGATWIERHYTLDKELKGSDHHTVSSDYAEMEVLLNAVHDAEHPLNFATLALKEEVANAEFYRRGT